MFKDPKEIINKIAQTIYDKKGINILALNVKGVSSITDYVVIAEGNVDRHVIAIGHELEHVLKEMGEEPIHVEGLQTGDWVVIDGSNYMIHLFQPGLRDKYQLEELFREGKVIDLKLDLDKTGSENL